jgi:sugar-specific transcriptional regulator TrmB/DNA-binding CsgD family transcriptional regulator
VAGLSPAEEAVYLRLLELPPVTAVEAGQACGEVADRAEVRSIVAGLADKGLLAQLPDQPSRYMPVPPERALDARLREREEEVRRARAEVADLTDKYRAVPRPSTGNELTEMVTGARRARQRWQAAMTDATTRVRILSHPSAEAESAEPDPVKVRLLARDVTLQCVYDESALASAAALARRRAEVAAGERARLTASVPVGLLVSDDRLGLLPLGSAALLVVHPGVLLEALCALFELVWAGALPLDLDCASNTAVGVPVLRNDTTRTVLGLLAAGMTDQAIARRLGRSERTVQRHIGKLIDAVGAKTRFQAALHIGHRHWAAPDATSATGSASITSRR